MRKFTRILSINLILIMVLNCIIPNVSIYAISDDAFEENLSVKSTEIVNIKDANLKALICNSLGIDTSSEITTNDMQNLHSLHGYNENITDLSGIENAINLEELSLPKNMISDLTPLKELNSLERLYLQENKITDLRSISNLNLQVLYLDGNNIKDISPLKSNLNLQVLYLGENDIKDISSLTTLVNLECLEISGNQIADFSPIQSLKNLENFSEGIQEIQLDTLIIEEEKKIDYEVIDLKDRNGNRKNINYISLYDGKRTRTFDVIDNKASITVYTAENTMGEITYRYDSGFNGTVTVTQKVIINSDAPIQTVTLPDYTVDQAVRNELDIDDDVPITPQILNSLESLTIWAQDKVDLTGLEHAKNLGGFILRGAKEIEGIDILNGLPNLSYIDISDSSIFNVDFTNGFSKLEQLVISNCELEPEKLNLSSLSNLRSLGYEYNTGDLCFLSNLTNLEYLRVIGYDFEDLSILENLVNLKTLDLINNNIKDINDVVKFSNLSALNLNNNQIENIEPISQLSKLEYLYLSDNKIKDISPLNNLYQLETIYLQRNQITDVRPIKDLTAYISMDDQFVELEEVGEVKPGDDFTYIPPVVYDRDGTNLTRHSSVSLYNMHGNDSGTYQVERGRAIIKSIPTYGELIQYVRAEKDQRFSYSARICQKLLGSKIRPSVTGVSHNGIYNNHVTIYFDKGIAHLMSNNTIINEIENGTTIYEEGNYQLIVEDDYENKTVIDFRIDKTAPVVDGVSQYYYNTDVIVTFDEGNATLNGKVFTSGSKVSANGEYTLVVTDEAGNTTITVFMIDKTAPVVDGVSHNKYYNKDVIITFNEGNATLNGNTFTSGSKVSANGKYTLVVTDEAGNKTTTVFTIDKTAPTLSVNQVSDKSTTITGTTEAKATVKLYLNGKLQIITVKADSKDKFAFKISKQKAGVVVKVVATDEAKNATTKSTTVVDKTAPTLSVNQVSDKSTTITGTTEAKATVKLYLNGKLQKTTVKADSKGKFSFKISKQKAGVVVKVVATDAAKNATTKSIKVLDKTAPAIPTVKTVKTTTTKVTGTAEKNATVYVYNGKTKLGTAKVNAKGSYSVSIKKQKNGAKLTIYVKDSAGNQSKSKTVTVKK
ncbi:hypothetical protein CYL18_06285 [Pradoshia eiseniae]|uniref:Bacterial Ig domain-containing protein n=1 Tax=Pradoshia eiseniae TaxID=2064768 RepID=A0A2S7N2H2_9BACI|nr:Ig-like domain-containing protein [Pradoshia eiseniae]PQD96203.1 hypothetical protein CYL18_06285 [Pradoshia eiseniae]